MRDPALLYYRMSWNNLITENISMEKITLLGRYVEGGRGSGRALKKKK
jgi:hypothetical protein